MSVLPVILITLLRTRGNRKEKKFNTLAFFKEYINYIFFLKNVLVFKICTPREANKALPDIDPRIKQIMFQKNHVVALQEELQSIIDANSPFSEFFKKKQELNAEVSALYRSIEQLENLGVIIKSVDEGLLDFPSKRFDEEVWFCWKVGEIEVKFWHRKDEGFARRKPLSPHDPSRVKTQGDLSDLR